jgi:hypothetical protein
MRARHDKRMKGLLQTAWRDSTQTIIPKIERTAEDQA